MVKRTTDIVIENVEEYEAILDILTFLNTRCLIKSAHDSYKQVLLCYGHDYNRCEICEEIFKHCDCEYEATRQEYGDCYSDEAEFE